MPSILTLGRGKGRQISEFYIANLVYMVGSETARVAVSVSKSKTKKPKPSKQTKKYIKVDKEPSRGISRLEAASRQKRWWYTRFCNCSLTYMHVVTRWCTHVCSHTKNVQR